VVSNVKEEQGLVVEQVGQETDEDTVYQDGRTEIKLCRLRACENCL